MFLVLSCSWICPNHWRQVLTHWGRVTHICVGKLTIIGSDNGLSPGRRQAIIWTNAEILLIGPLGTNFSENSIRVQTFAFQKMHFKMSSAKWRLFRLGVNEFSRECRCSWSSTYIGAAPPTSEWSTILFPIKVRLILEVWRYICLYSTVRNVHHHGQYQGKLIF